MPLPSCLWLALAAAPPVPEPEAAAPESGGAGTQVAVLPLTVTGELPTRWRAEAESRLAAGLSRGALAVSAAPDVPGTCSDPACWAEQPQLAAADFVVSATLAVGDARDYTLAIDVSSTKTGSVVASAEGTCELCGFEEAVAMIQTRAAVLAPEVARLGAALPLLLFRSDPAGAVVSLDGQMVGPTPVRIAAPAGAHQVDVAMAGFLSQSFSIEAVDGVRKEVALQLVREPEPPLPAGRGLIIAGAATTGAGVATLAVGAVLLGLDGRDFRRRCEVDTAGRCPFDYETTIGGAVSVSLGGAAIVGGISMLAVGVARSRRARASRTRAQARVQASGSGVVVHF